MQLSITDLTEVQPAVQCSVCGQWHSVQAGTFLSILGDIRIGANQEIAKTNLTGNAVTSVTILCRKNECLLLLTDSFASADPDFERIADRARTWHDRFSPAPGTQDTKSVTLLTPATIVGRYGEAHPVEGELSEDLPLTPYQKELLDAVSAQLVEDTKDEVDPVTVEDVDQAISNVIIESEALQQLDETIPLEPVSKPDWQRPSLMRMVEERDAASVAVPVQPVAGQKTDPWRSPKLDAGS